MPTLDREARAQGRVPMVVGGTGFYLRALFGDALRGAAARPGARAALERELSRLSDRELRRWARELDPARAHLGRTQLLRAIEIALLTGHRSAISTASGSAPARWSARYLVVDPGPSSPTRSSSASTRCWRTAGAEEVRRLIDRGPGGRAGVERDGLSNDSFAS